MLYDDLVPYGDYICHHGIKGQKWGVRRYQNFNVSLTAAGRKRYYKSIEQIAAKQYDKNGLNAARSKDVADLIDKEHLDKLRKIALKSNESYNKLLDIDEEICNEIINDNKLLQNYADLINLDKSQRSDRGLIINLFDEDPLLGEPNFYKEIGYNNNNNKLEELYTAQKTYRDIAKEHSTECRKVAKEYLGKYRNKSLSIYDPYLKPYINSAETFVTSNLLQYTSHYYKE